MFLLVVESVRIASCGCAVCPGLSGHVSGLVSSVIPARGDIRYHSFICVRISAFKCRLAGMVAELQATSDLDAKGAKDGLIIINLRILPSSSAHTGTGFKKKSGWDQNKYQRKNEKFPSEWEIKQLFDYSPKALTL